ncbi:MAG: TolC family protein [Calditrichae bacterium]|nr:TolC family protein [Calditrichota bacterium]MCB9058946.1 TolC family protein [Calditrichia bacterium]
MIKIVWVLILLLNLALSQQILTAENAIKTALENNYSIQIARNNAEIAENNAGLGTAGFLPRLDATASKSYSVTDEKTNSQFSFGNRDTEQLLAQLALSWTIFDGFSMFASKSRFDALSRLGEAQSRLTIENTVVTVLAAYFNVVQQQQLYEINKNNLQLSRERLEKEKVRKEMGGISSTDFLRSQVAFNADSSVLLQSQLNLLTAKNTINTLLARDLKTPFEVSSEITVPVHNRTDEEWLKLALERNALIKTSKANLLAAEKNITINTASFYPRISLSGAYNYTDRLVTAAGREITTDAKDKSIGLNVSFNLFNGFRDNITRQNAILEERNKQLELQQTELQVKAALEESMINFENRMKVLSLERQNVEAATRSFEVQKERYQIGTTTSLDFRDAQISLNRSQVSYIAAQYQARIAILELEQLAGIIEISY